MQTDQPVSAKIEPLPDDVAGKVLTRRNLILGNLLTLTPLLGLIGGLGLLWLGGLHAFPDEKDPRWLPPSEGERVTGYVIMTMGVIFLATGVVLGLRNPGWMGNRFLRKEALHHFGMRLGLLVDPKDPHALFVEIVPRQNWGQMGLDSASDIGFLRIDETGSRLLFEGDRERYTIPARAILSCTVGSYMVGQGTHGVATCHIVILSVRNGDAGHEIPIAPRGESWKRNTKKSLPATIEFRQSLLRIRPDLCREETPELGIPSETKAGFGG